MDSNTFKDLQTFCRLNQIKGFSKFKKKQELLEFVNNEINIRDAELAQQLFDSEDEYMKKKQDELILQQQKEIQENKQKEKILKQQMLEQENTMKLKQDEEYEKALQEDLKMLEQEKIKQEKIKQENILKQEIDKKYSVKISNEDLEMMRLARIARFS